MNLYFIGTLHAQFTPHAELIDEIRKLSPDILLVEMTQDDINRSCIVKCPDEMQASYHWALENNITVCGFDVDIQTLASSMSEYDNTQVIQEQAKILEKYSWKEVNKSKINKLFDLVPGAKELVDQNKVEQRDKAMKRNIISIITANKDKNIVVLTGCGHLDFFQENFSEAQFPLRD